MRAVVYQHSVDQVTNQYHITGDELLWTYHDHENFIPKEKSSFHRNSAHELYL